MAFDPRNYSSTGPLAQAMAARRASIGITPQAPNPAMAQQMAMQGQLNPNLVTPSTVGHDVQQPMRSPFSPYGAPTPQSDLRTQTGNGGGMSNIPGSSTGGPTQQGGTGGAKVNPLAFQAQREYAAANSPGAKSAASDTIRQHQIAMGLVRADGGSNAGDNYRHFLNAGMPGTNAQGQTLDTRGQVMDPGAWNTGVMAGPQGQQSPQGAQPPHIPSMLGGVAAQGTPFGAQNFMGAGGQMQRSADYAGNYAGMAGAQGGGMNSLAGMMGGGGGLGFGMGRDAQYQQLAGAQGQAQNSMLGGMQAQSYPNFLGTAANQSIQGLLGWQPPQAQMQPLTVPPAPQATAQQPAQQQAAPGARPTSGSYIPSPRG